MKKILSAFICLMLTACFTLSSQHAEANEVNYVLISSNDLEHLNVLLRTSIDTLFPGARQIYLDYNSEEAKRHIEEFGIKFIPFVIYDDSITGAEHFTHVVRHKMVEKVNENYIIPQKQLRLNEIMLLGRKRDPNNLTMFVMCLGPNTKKNQARLINFIREHKPDIKLDVKYLVDFNEFGMSSPNGPEEIRESLRQIALQRYYPDKFIDYLALIQDKGFAEALKELNISQEDLDSREEETTEVLKGHYEQARALGISHSPTFLWENILLIPNIDVLQRYPPFSGKQEDNIDISKASGPIPIEFFYSDSCRSCLGIKQDLLPRIKSKYKDKITINYHNISHFKELELKLAFEKKFGILRGAIPEIFLPAAALKGKSEIGKGLAPAIDKILGQKELKAGDEVIPDQSIFFEKFSSFSPAVVAFAGLIDGINPCAFATMVFFVSFLAVNSYRKDQIVYIGSSFIFSVFLTYLVLGLGIFQILKKVQSFAFFSQMLYYCIALLAMGLGIYSLCDYISFKKTGQARGCNLKLYNRLRAVTESRGGLIILVIMTFVNGIIIALLESACTGQVYLPTIAFLMKVPSLRLHAFLYLVFYNLFFILPLVLIFLLACKGASSEKFSQFEQRHLGAVKLSFTILFFGLAILLFAL